MAQGMKRVFITKLTETNTADKETVGTVRPEGDNEYVYGKATEAVAAGEVAQFGYSASSMYAMKLAHKSSIAVARIAVAVGSFSASDYGWFQVRGLHSAVVTPAKSSRTASIAVGGTVYAVGTTGTISADSTSNTEIVGMAAAGALGASASSTTVAAALNYPRV
jgi:hypothetical protein